jgi:PAS domain S-box-containing protein
MDTPKSTSPHPSRIADVSYQTNLDWIRHGLWLAASGYSFVVIYSVLQGQTVLKEISPLSTALISFLCLALVRKHPLLAASLVLLAVWAELVETVFIIGNFVDPAFLVFPLLVNAAGLLVGSQGASMAAAASVAGMTAAGLLGGATLQRLQMNHGKEGFGLCVAICGTIASAVLTKAALRSYSDVLTKSERDRQRYQGLFEYLPEGLLSLDPAGRIVDANDAASRLLCCPRETLLGQSFHELVARLSGSSPVDVIQTKDFQQTFELVSESAQAGPITLELIMRSISMPEAPTLVLVRDVTHRKLIEQHLGHAQRLEAVGQLAGGIAHDFNNLLTAIGGSAEIISQFGDDESKESASVILAAQKRGSNLTRQLLAFARRDAHKPGAIDLSRTVVGMSQIVQRLLGRQHRLIMGDGEPVWVEADGSQIEQVVLNLVTNACDAMEGGGDVRISVRALPVNEARSLGSRLGNPHQALLEVADTGTGIPEHLKARIFEPFFTTKERGKGTGLGLAAVQGIVAQNQGCLALDSSLGQGSKFRIFFGTALQPSEAPEEGTDRPALGASTSQRSHLLVVDDEEEVRLTASRLLRREGYSVLSAANGVDALKILEATPQVNVVLTDLAMPQMDGRELGAQVSRRFPSVRILYMSGYFNDPGLSPLSSTSTAVFLAKPFSREQLLEAIRAAEEIRV